MRPLNGVRATLAFLAAIFTVFTEFLCASPANSARRYPTIP